ncbi:MAG: GIY-YIG nuclease family protein [Candidatus Omnitrophota bacterium]
MHYVYIIRSEKTKSHYIGSTADVEKRITQHNNNQTRATRHKGPFTLAYKEPLETKAEARKRENQIKRFKGNRQFRRLIGKTNNLAPSSSQA